MCSYFIVGNKIFCFFKKLVFAFLDEGVFQGGSQVLVKSIFQGGDDTLEGTMSLQKKNKNIRQKSSEMSVTRLISAFNVGFFLMEIDEIKTTLTPQLLQFEPILMIFQAMSSWLALYKMSLVPAWLITASGVSSTSESMI